MTKASGLWRTILPGFFLGLILTMLATSGAFALGVSGSPIIILAILLLVAIAIAVKIPKHRTLTISAMAGGLTGTIVSFLAVIVLFSGGLFSTSVQDDMPPAELERWIGIDFPTSATSMRSHAEGFQDWQVFVRFEMPKSDVKEFLRINHLEPESNPNTNLADADLERDWWKPDGTTKPRLFAQTGKPGAETQPTTKTGFYPTIQISELEGGMVTVYVSAFNT